MTAPRGPKGPERDRSTEMGGADAVNDTPAVAGRGTEPGNAERRAATRSTGTGGRGMPMLGWVAILLALVMIAIFGFGLFRG